jgi:hypothetical protein
MIKKKEIKKIEEKKNHAKEDRVNHVKVARRRARETSSLCVL